MSYLRRLSHSRKRRVRKKHRLGEFLQIGFSFTAFFPSDVSVDAVTDRFIELVEERNLFTGGGVGSNGSMRTLSMYVTAQGRSCTEADFRGLGADLRIAFPNATVSDEWKPSDAWSTKDE